MHVLICLAFNSKYFTSVNSELLCTLLQNEILKIILLEII